MANSRELAEQAFSLLQDALKDSESRVAELDAELKKKRVPKDKLQEQVQVLEHRVETVEADRQKWQMEAQRLDEIVENERARLKQLKQKLDVAESGPDRVGKKEVNYWRSRAEKFDEETKQYKERIAELKTSLQKAEENLNEERECTVNLSEVANERREQISELSEKLDEAQERYEEAQWHLNRASRFARLVVRRRAIIAALIKTVRIRQKSNVALKAGLDGLRKFKARSEQQQQKQLMQIDELKTRLRATEEKVSEQKALVEAKDKAIAELNAELELQAAEVQAAELQAAELQAAQQQVAELQAAQQQAAQQPAEPDADAVDATSIRERDSRISDLDRMIKDQEKEIARLNMEVAGWQRKYEFLSTDTPSAYAKSAEN